MISLTNYDFQWARSELVIIYPEKWYEMGFDPSPRSASAAAEVASSGSIKKNIPGLTFLEIWGFP